jgi:hypothetical protein
MVSRQFRNQIINCGTRLDPLAESGMMTSPFDVGRRPTKGRWVLTSLNVPFTEIPVFIADSLQTLGPMGQVRAEITLIWITPVLDFKNAMIVRQNTRHQGCSRRRAGR